MGTHRPEDTSLSYRSGLPYRSVGTMPSADCCWMVREIFIALSHFPWPATSQGVPPLSRGKSQPLLRLDAGFTKHSLSGWRTWWLRAHSSQDCHASYPVRVPRPAHSFHAAFRPHFAVTPLRFPCPSPPRWLDRGLSPPSVETCPAHTLPITCRRPTVSFQAHSKPQAGGGQGGRVRTAVTHPSSPQSRTGAINSSGSSVSWPRWRSG